MQWEKAVQPCSFLAGIWSHLDFLVKLPNIRDDNSLSQFSNLSSLWLSRLDWNGMKYSHYLTENGCSPLPKLSRSNALGKLKPNASIIVEPSTTQPSFFKSSVYVITWIVMYCSSFFRFFSTISLIRRENMTTTGRSLLLESIAQRQSSTDPRVRRRVLFTGFQQLVNDHSRLLQEVNSIYQKVKNSRDEIRKQIDQWEVDMIGRVHVKAEHARGKLAQLIDTNESGAVVEKAQDLDMAIEMQGKEADLPDSDFERLKESTEAIKKVKEKFTALRNVELYTEPRHMIDWNHLIYFRKQLTTGISTKEHTFATEKAYANQSTDTDDINHDETLVGWKKLMLDGSKISHVSRGRGKLKVVYWSSHLYTLHRYFLHLGIGPSSQTYVSRPWCS